MSDKIETMSDWNARLAQCGCCSMPVAPSPVMECKSLWVEAGADSVFYDDDGIPHSEKIIESKGTVSESDTSELYRLNFLLWTTGPEYTASTTNATDSRKRIENTVPPIRISKCGVNNVSVTEIKLEGSYTRTTTDTLGYADAYGGGGPVYKTHLMRTLVVEEEIEENEWVKYVKSSSDSADGDYPTWTFISDDPLNEGPLDSSIPFINEEVSYQDPIAKEAVKTALMREIKAMSFEECPDHNEAGCNSSYMESITNIDGFGDFIVNASANKAQYRWVIPSSWGGAIFKITWDILTTPQTWTDWKAKTAAHEEWKTAKSAWDKSKSPDKGPAPTEPEKPGDKPSPPSLEKGKTVTWKGPGKGEQGDKSWIAGDWFPLDPPSKPGTKRIVNIRYDAMPANPYGSKPETMGEGYDPANP
jgi:hypothetical protein